MIPPAWFSLSRLVKTTLFRSFFAVFLFCLCALGENNTLATATSPHAVVKLISRNSACIPGAPCQLGFLFELEPGWHIYWKNPGDSGSAPKFSIIEPTQFTPISLDWPVPHKMPLAHLVNYGYEGTVLIPFSISSEDLSTVHGDSFALLIEGEWLVCHEDCIPGTGNFQATVLLKNTITASETNNRFDGIKKPIPLPSPDYIQAQIDASTLTVTIRDTSLEQEVQIYPEQKGLFTPSHQFSKLVAEQETIFSIPVQHTPKEQNSLLVVNLGATAYSVPISLTTTPSASADIRNKHDEKIPGIDGSFVSPVLTRTSGRDNSQLHALRFSNHCDESHRVALQRSHKSACSHC